LRISGAPVTAWSAAGGRRAGAAALPDPGAGDGAVAAAHAGGGDRGDGGRPAALQQHALPPRWGSGRAGVAELPAWLIRDDLETGRLVRVLPAVSAQAVVVNGIYYRQGRGAAGVRALLDHLAAEMPRA